MANPVAGMTAPGSAASASLTAAGAAWIASSELVAVSVTCSPMEPYTRNRSGLLGWGVSIGASPPTGSKVLSDMDCSCRYEGCWCGIGLESLAVGLPGGWPGAGRVGVAHRDRVVV